MATYTMFRGDYKEFTITLPKSSYQTGSIIHFCVKKALDNANNDSAAVFTIDLTDANIIQNTSESVVYKVIITKALTNTYQFEGDTANLIAEVEFNAPGDKPTTFPQFEFLILKDANRR